ncbi:hypothetical protein B0H14DRAFT_3448168 [Mycena olivaceomarginata]|nr:hypothetical protein B0H14DRAFT_3448168 [Mycena olivaceomarginata]
MTTRFAGRRPLSLHAAALAPRLRCSFLSGPSSFSLPAPASSLTVHVTAFVYFLVVPVAAHRFANKSRPHLHAFAPSSQPSTEHGFIQLALSDGLHVYHWCPMVTRLRNRSAEGDAGS